MKYRSTDENRCARCGHTEGQHTKSGPKICIGRLPTSTYERLSFRYCTCRSFVRGR